MWQVTLKGFYGRRDWQALEVDPRVGFTFLRHPVERVLSLMFFLLDNPEHSDPEDFFDTVSSWCILLHCCLASADLP